MRAYADSSFVTSLYSTDSNSDAALSLLSSITPPFWISDLTLLEVRNAIDVRQFRRQATTVDTRRASTSFGNDLAARLFHLIPVAPEVWQDAIALSERHAETTGVRTLDLLHVAIALQVGADCVLSFDRRQRALAAAEGLAVLPTDFL